MYSIKTYVKRSYQVMGKNILAAIGVTIGTILSSSFPKGYEDYTVQKEQYFVEYSEKYD